LKTILAVSYLCILNSGFGQTNEIDSQINIIEKANVVSGYNKGINGIISEEYLAYLKLREICSFPELRYLIEHKNPHVRAYAFMALSIKNPKLAEAALNDHRSDFEMITVMDGCFGERKTVAAFMRSKGLSLGKPLGF
jgi:hypothetical protein